MKLFLSVLVVIVGVVLGIYVGFWVMFIGGIMYIIDMVQADTVAKGKVVLGVLRILFAGFVGVFITKVGINVGTRLLNSYEKEGP